MSCVRVCVCLTAISRAPVCPSVCLSVCLSWVDQCHGWLLSLPRYTPRHNRHQSSAVPFLSPRILTHLHTHMVSVCLSVCRFECHSWRRQAAMGYTMRETGRHTNAQTDRHLTHTDTCSSMSFLPPFSSRDDCCRVGVLSVLLCTLTLCLCRCYAVLVVVVVWCAPRWCAAAAEVFLEGHSSVWCVCALFMRGEVRLTAAYRCVKC